jgi:hypothetical protein
MALNWLQHEFGGHLRLGGALRYVRKFSRTYIKCSHYNKDDAISVFLRSIDLMNGSC